MIESTRTNRTTAPKSVFRSGWHWPVLVVVIFTGNMAFAAWVLVTASSDPSFAVEKDYYTRALHWNDEIEQRTRNAELGWTATVDGPACITSNHHAELIVHVLDAEGRPISDATVTAMAFPVARAGTATAITFDGIGPGRYAARLEEPRLGKWELRLSVEHDVDLFTTRLDALVTGE